jgi:hypothetical protein
VVGAGGSAADGAADGAAAEQPGSAEAAHRDAAAIINSFAGIRRGRPIP